MGFNIRIFVCLTVLLGLFGAIICDETTYNSDNEVPVVNEGKVVPVFINTLGNREYLAPHLPGLQNMAIAFLPKNLQFSNIIEAFREITNHVKYDILVRSVDPDKNDVICHIVVKEIYWRGAELGRKLRALDHSNCSSEYIETYVGESHYFQPKSTELSRDRIQNLESQIIPNEKKPTDENYNSYEQINPTTERSNDNSENTEDDTEKPGELSGGAMSLLDDIFSVNVPAQENRYSSPNNNAGNPINLKDESLTETESRKKRSITNCDGENCDPHQKWTRKSLNEKSHKTHSSGLTKEDRLFRKFQRKFKKVYSNSLEEQLRFLIFKTNLLKIEELNRFEQGTAKYGLTEFADMTTTEYRQRTGLNTNLINENAIKNPVAEIPDFKLPREFDWRKKNVVSEVKDQGSCGSCWAFSVTGNIEGLHAIKTGTLEEYSEQELVDCDTEDNGCGGGLPDNAYQAIAKLGGLELESDYPYQARKEKCNMNKTMVHVQVRGAVDLPKNETAMALWLIANGPISIGINANAMQFYRGGISHPYRLLCRHGSIDHGVLIVGFGVSEYPLFNKTLPYWIIKNSWGPSWGEQGYYRVFRGDNTCGVNSMASSAILA